MTAHGTDIRLAGLLKGRFNEPGKFGRMFPHLRSLKVPSNPNRPGANDLRVPPSALGAAFLKDGAATDPGFPIPDPLPDGVTPGPMNGGVAPDPSQDNPRIRAGLTFLGQFIDHDVTFDPTSMLERQNDPNSTQNFRTPMLELDSLYGAGPSVQPYLYDSRRRFRIASRGSASDPNTPLQPCDVPRIDDRPVQTDARHIHTAIIADPRNDENLIVNQIHLAFMKFHNAVLDGPANGEFEEAQRIVRWHYQWIVLHEYLPAICGEDVVKDVLDKGPRFFSFKGEPYMPVEFSVAAFRFGHSQVRPGYLIQAERGLPLFGPDALAQQPPTHPSGQPFSLRGSRIVPPEFALDFTRFFGAGSNAQQSKRIDFKLSQPLLFLPPTVVGEGAPLERRSLATRNIERGLAFALPSGQTIAKFMDLPVIPDAQLWDGVPGGTGEAPLWYYILREAEVRQQGKRLDGIGARIVAEVFLGLLFGDKASYVNQWPSWKPEIPSAGKAHLSYTEEPTEKRRSISKGEAAGGVFTFFDLLRFAGVVAQDPPPPVPTPSGPTWQG